MMFLNVILLYKIPHMGRDLSECDDKKKRKRKKATLFSQLKKTKRRKILNVGGKESHWTHSGVSIAPQRRHVMVFVSVLTRSYPSIH